MGLLRKVPSELVERTQQEHGGADGPNRFASARFEVKLPRKPASPAGKDSDTDACDDHDPSR